MTESELQAFIEGYIGEHYDEWRRDPDGALKKAVVAVAVAIRKREAQWIDQTVEDFSATFAELIDSRERLIRYMCQHQAAPAPS